MIIRNVRRYNEAYRFIKEDIYILDSRIVSKAAYEKVLGDMADAREDHVIDGKGMYAFPGLVDIHFHGAVGRDFCDASLEGLKEIAAYEAGNGVLAICPATMTYPEDRLTEIMKAADDYHRKYSELQISADHAGNGTVRDNAAWMSEGMNVSLMADLVGINLEGPFISSRKMGAQNPEYIRKADAMMIQRLQEACHGLIKIIDMAPEVDGNLAFIREHAQDYCISLAHSDTDYETAKAAFAAGMRHVTHLFNAMNGIHHRHPGPVIAALEAGAEVELIGDGVHVHPAMVRFIFDTFGADRVILISDTMRAAGLSDGIYSLGGQEVVVKGNQATLKTDASTIAGSVTHLFDCLRCTVREMGIPLEAALRAATYNPARSIGIEKDFGSLAPGCLANVLLVTDDLEICGIIKNGVLYS